MNAMSSRDCFCFCVSLPRYAVVGCICLSVGMVIRLSLSGPLARMLGRTGLVCVAGMLLFGSVRLCEALLGVGW